MAEHGVDVGVAKNGDLWIPLAQPYSRFIEEMLASQTYPEVRMTGADEILAPYDVSTWSLPLLMNVEVEKRKMPYDVETTPLSTTARGVCHRQRCAWPTRPTTRSAAIPPRQQRS